MITLKTDLDLFKKANNLIYADDELNEKLIGLPLRDQDGNCVGQVTAVSPDYGYIYFVMTEDAYFNGTHPSVSMSFEVMNKE